MTEPCEHVTNFYSGVSTGLHMAMLQLDAIQAAVLATPPGAEAWPKELSREQAAEAMREAAAQIATCIERFKGLPEPNQRILEKFSRENTRALARYDQRAAHEAQTQKDL